MKPEEKARQQIDQLLTAAGWAVQDLSQLDLGASPGVAVREFSLTGGFAGYLLPVDRRSGARAALDGEALDLVPAHQPALHPAHQPPARPGPGGFRALLQPH